VFDALCTLRSGLPNRRRTTRLASRFSSAAAFLRSTRRRYWPARRRPRWPGRVLALLTGARNALDMPVSWSGATSKSRMRVPSVCHRAGRRDATRSAVCLLRAVSVVAPVSPYLLPGILPNMGRPRGFSPVRHPVLHSSIRS